ncbi:hypothetical protein E2C01_087501 [Portunus trituberculatus]|uniref:Uncharacterized protein n=1 Tax=Portunus trituberculatus TaxID=210409 RepID=A0A5B7JDI8_PORTR|nr:hypothetical protein [Portunus trituberculatus]
MTGMSIAAGGSTVQGPLVDVVSSLTSPTYPALLLPPPQNNSSLGSHCLGRSPSNTTCLSPKGYIKYSTKKEHKH